MNSLIEMWLKLVLLICNLFSSQAANILFLSMILSRSHHIWNSAITYELANRGHNITVLSPEANKAPPHNIHYILIENLYDDIHEERFRGVIETFNRKHPFHEVISLQGNYNRQCLATVKSIGFKTLLKYPDNFNFDLVIFDFTSGPCLLPFLHKFNYPPLIAVTAYGQPSCLNSIIGGHHYYSYIPHVSLGFDDNMSFFQRLYNFAVYLEELIFQQYFNIQTIDDITNKYFGDKIPSVGELQRRAKIALINTNPVIDYLAPLPENVIPVAGLHIEDPKPLPKDLEVFFNTAEKGVVLFSLGTNLQSKYISKQKQKLFIDVFAQLTDYNFLWKFESNVTAIELPANVQIHPWLPQSTILSHPRLKAFITHGGMLSIQEAIWLGVPLVVLPFIFDQNTNFIKTKNAGIAEGLDFLALTEDNIKQTLLRVLTTPKYKRNAEKLSKQFRDQKEKPLERAIWWIEWVMRNPDSEFLKSPVLRLGYFVGQSFDVVAFVILLLILIIIISYIIIYFTVQKLFKSFKSRINKSKKIN